MKILKILKYKVVDQIESYQIKSHKVHARGYTKNLDRHKEQVRDLFKIFNSIYRNESIRLKAGQDLRHYVQFLIVESINFRLQKMIEIYPQKICLLFITIQTKRYSI